MLPVGGILIAVFCGWLLDKRLIQAELGWDTSGVWFKCWRFIMCFVAPLAVVLIMLA
jgi:NSS family neurotransmitter:Na+ symporter